MKRKFKRCWSKFPPMTISTKRTITSHLNSLHTKKTKTYDIGNPGPGWDMKTNVAGLDL
jgi:hypothetical protein